MRWEFGRRSQNVEDRRGRRVAGPVVGGGIGAILLAVVVTLLGGDPSAILNQVASDGQSGAPQATSPQEDRLAEFSKVVLADTEDVWTDLFRRQGANYREPTLVLFSGSVRSACGYAQSASGPFYCPTDEKVYLDLSFFEELASRHQAPGDAAQAYVIAHEVGHHVQKQLGILQKIQGLQQRVSQTQSNQLSIMLELQADCFAGVWANQAQRTQRNVALERGDVEEALRAASSVGDDYIQLKTRGYVVPESFNHGTSEQRTRWFARGLQTGDPAQCDTFNASSL
ncbi:MAG: neutral zinc metallopeptidase [Leptolyngbya sp. IPPAS B-1204]|nr:zinc metallopeptidase [Elainella sp. C42_A2020_010]RNJ68941.1 MAG: flagellar biosynthesis protein FlgM [Leptolyngbya sp. IPPAS B-1204]